MECKTKVKISTTSYSSLLNMKQEHVATVQVQYATCQQYSHLRKDKVQVQSSMFVVVYDDPYKILPRHI